MRINLGCGTDIKPGYLNVDFRELPGVDLVADLSKYPWPFLDGEVEEALMYDFLEHFPWHSTADILNECWRVLQPGGDLVIQVPDGQQLTRAFNQCGMYHCNRCGFHMGAGEFSAIVPCKKCGQTADEVSEAAMRRMYGGQDYPGNFHHTLFTEKSLDLKCEAAGFQLVDYEELEHQELNWNFKARYRKGDPWTKIG